MANAFKIQRFSPNGFDQSLIATVSSVSGFLVHKPPQKSCHLGKKDVDNQETFAGYWDYLEPADAVSSAMKEAYWPIL